MWPKVLMQLLPHVTELGPLIKKLTQARAAGDDATRLALERKLESVAAGLRQDITEASTSLPAEVINQLAEHGQLLAAVSGEVRLISSAAKAFEERVAQIERSQKRQQLLLVLLILLTLVLFACTIILLRHR